MMPKAYWISNQSSTDLFSLVRVEHNTNVLSNTLLINVLRNKNPNLIVEKALLNKVSFLSNVMLSYLDPDYLKFVENLDKSPVMLPSAQRQFEEEEAQRLAAGEGNDGIIMTPLMECIVKKYLNKAASKSNVRDCKRKLKAFMF